VEEITAGRGEESQVTDVTLGRIQRQQSQQPALEHHVSHRSTPAQLAEATTCGMPTAAPIDLGARARILSRYGSDATASTATMRPWTYRSSVTVLGVGAQSTLGEHQIFARKICIKNQQNARILHDTCPKKYQNTRIFMIFARKIYKITEFYMILPETCRNFM